LVWYVPYTVAALLFCLQHSLSPGQFNPVNHPFGRGEMPERGRRGQVLLLRRAHGAPSPLLQSRFNWEKACGLLYLHLHAEIFGSLLPMRPPVGGQLGKSTDAPKRPWL
jgi:hypothetical protein